MCARSRTEKGGLVRSLATESSQPKPPKPPKQHAAPLASQDPSACSFNTTVTACVVTADDKHALASLAASARAYGFPCIVVQPTSSRIAPSPHVLVLPPPYPPLLPRSRWYNGTGYGHRRVQLHRMRHWQALLNHGLNVLARNPSHTLLRNPLPPMAAMRTRAASGNAIPDVLGSTPGWFMKHYYLSSPLFICICMYKADHWRRLSSRATLALYITLVTSKNAARTCPSRRPPPSCRLPSQAS